MNRIVVLARPPRFHDIVKNWRDSLEAEIADQRRLVRDFPRAKLSVRVVIENTQRLYRISDALLKYWEQVGISINTKHYGALRLDLGREQLHLSIFETGSGLVVRLDTATTPFARRKWSDRPTRPLETQLDKIDDAIVTAFSFLAIRRRRYEDELRKREEETRRQQEEIRRRTHEEERWVALAGLGRRWEEVKAISGLLDALEAALLRSGEFEGSAEFFAWARGRLKAMDPLTDPADTIRQVPPPLSANDRA